MLDITKFNVCLIMLPTIYLVYNNFIKKINLSITLYIYIYKI